MHCLDSRQYVPFKSYDGKPKRIVGTGLGIRNSSERRKRRLPISFTVLASGLSREEWVGLVGP